MIFSFNREEPIFRIMKQIVFFSLTCMILQACTSGKSTQSSSDDPNAARSVGVTQSISEVDPQNSTLELSDYLRKVPGVQVTGSKNNPTVKVRTSTSVTSGTEPLYVIDNTPVGNSYQSAAQQVDVNDIKTIRVLKDVSSASMYGMRGANGVIIIITKK